MSFCWTNQRMAFAPPRIRKSAYQSVSDLRLTFVGAMPGSPASGEMNMFATAFRKVCPNRLRFRAHTFTLLLILLLTAGRAHAASLADYQFTPGWATFGLALPRGAATSGVIVGQLPTQTDIKTTWPDGSIRFAIVTTKILTAGTYSITAAGSSSSASAMPVWPSASVTLVIGGVPYTAALPAFVGSNNWLSAGSLVRESRVVVEPRSASALHPFLQVVYDIRSYADGGHRVDVSVQNARDIAASNAVTYDVAITVNGASVFSKSGVVHNFGARWRKIFLAGGLVESDVTPDFTPFYTSNALPTYLDTVSNGTWPSDTAAFDILQFGDMSMYMNAPGGRPEISTYPHWTVQYLVNKTKNQRQHMLANANLAGSWSGYINEPDGVSLLRLDRHPNYWLDGRSPAPDGPANGYAGSGPHVDATHVPSLSYVPYMVTGDRFYLDTLKVWTNTMLLQTYTGPAHGFGDAAGVDSNRQGAMGLLAPYSNEPRGFGWGLRELVDASMATPDSDPDKAYFAQRVQNNLNWLNDYAGKPGGGYLNPPFWEFDQGNLHVGYYAVPMWQSSYVTWAVDHAGLNGFAPTAAFRARAVSTMIKLMTSAPALPPEYGASVYYPRYGTFVNGIHTPFATMQDFFNANYTGPADSLDGTSTTIPRAPGPILGYYGSDYRMLLLMGVRDGMAGADTALNWLMNYRSAGQGVLDDIEYRSGYALAPFPSYAVPAGSTVTTAPPPADTQAPTVPSNVAATPA